MMSQNSGQSTIPPAWVMLWHCYEEWEASIDGETCTPVLAISLSQVSNVGDTRKFGWFVLLTNLNAHIDTYGQSVQIFVVASNLTTYLNFENGFDNNTYCSHVVASNPYSKSKYVLIFDATTCEKYVLLSNPFSKFKYVDRENHKKLIAFLGFFACQQDQTRGQIQKPSHYECNWLGA
jgi:hypothetical protein